MKGLLRRAKALVPAGTKSVHSDTRLESRPTPWVPMVAGGAVAGLVLVCLGASALVQVDQQVSAVGQLNPLRSTQDIKAPESGVVIRVFVREGQEVAPGQALALLDPVILKGKTKALQDQQQQLGVITSQELARLQGALGQVRAERAGLLQSRLILKEQVAGLVQLQTEGAASRFQLLDYQKQLSDVVAKLAANSQEQRKLTAESNQRRAELNSKQAENQATKVETETRLGRVTLRAPVRGTVLNLKAKTGNVINAGVEPLMQLVPTDNLQGVVYVSNQDLAFVRPEQQAEVSVDAYDRSRYGTLQAVVTTIGTDSLPPDAQFNFSRFPIGLRLKSQTLQRDGQTFRLQAGMAITADLRLEKRTLFELLFSSISNSARAVKSIR
jgi:multidrug resistance efflux pump